jgi:hypothetical protein
VGSPGRPAPGAPSSAHFVAEVTFVTPGEVREGTVYRERSGPAFLKSPSEWTVTRLDRPRELVDTSRERSVPAEATWIGVLGRVLEAAFATRMTRREMARMLHDLKRLAESSAQRPRPRRRVGRLGALAGTVDELAGNPALREQSGVRAREGRSRRCRARGQGRARSASATSERAKGACALSVPPGRGEAGRRVDRGVLPDVPLMSERPPT